VLALPGPGCSQSLLHGAEEERGGRSTFWDFETMHPLEWLARKADHIPDPGRHRTLFYGYYANRPRGDRTAEQPGEDKVDRDRPRGAAVVRVGRV
jgi:hypothetical protein